MWLHMYHICSNKHTSSYKHTTKSFLKISVEAHFLPLAKWYFTLRLSALYHSKDKDMLLEYFSNVKYLKFARIPILDISSLETY